MNQDFQASAVAGYGFKVDEDTARYINDYWIDRENLESSWVRVIASVFKRRRGNVTIAEGPAVDVLQGGILFTKDEFLAFIALANATGAVRFAVVEDIGQTDWSALQEFSFFRFSYPLDIDWDEMTRSCILAQDVFGRPIRCFFVVTDNGKVGKYANNDAPSPYDIVFRA